ncbi:MAG: HEAT repeat domain-containing protein, partial [Kiritimatiellae bacterium]|nr:HEAT repeat domain-containing protein [Kiritimatiellia bacterium]
MTAAGILFGVVLFLLRRAVSPRSSRNCGTLKRELLLNAVIVSGMLSYLSSCSSRALGKDAQDTQTKVAPAGAMVTNIQAFEQTKEWQDLKVLWNLITGNLDFLQNDSGSPRIGFPGIPAWKIALLNATVDYRMTQLDRLVQQGILSVNTRKAIATLFTDMVGHVGRSNSGATCYAMTEEGGRWANAMSCLETQARELRKHYRDGSLKDGVLKDIEAQLQEKLRVLEILGDSGIDEVTDEEITTRIRQWRQQGRIHVRWIDGKTRREVREEITKEKESKLSRDEAARRKEAWNRNQEMILALAVDLGRYAPDRTGEKEIEKEFSGKVARDRIMARLKTANSYEKKSLVEGLAAVGGAEAVPVLKELLNDMTMRSYSTTSASSDSCDSSDPQAMEKYERSMTSYVEYPVRDAAAAALRELGVNAPGESKKLAESPEGRAMVKEALGSSDPEVRRSAIRAAGMTRDKTLIPVIEKILQNDSSAVDDVLRAFGEIGDPSVLPLVISEADKGDADPWAIGSTLREIGTKESLGYLQKLTFSSKDPSMRECAIRLLSEKKDKSFLPMFKEALKDKEIVVKLSAAIALQDIGCEDGFLVLAEAAKASDRDLRNQAMCALKQSKDPRASEFLKTYAYTPDGDGQKEALLTIIGKGGEDGRMALETILKGSDSEQKRQALYLVGNSTAAIPGIEVVLAKSLDSADEDLRRAAVWALKDKGTTNVIPRLLAYGQSRQDDIGGGMDAGDAIKEIKKRTTARQLGSLLSDITGDDKTKREQAEKRKASLSDADVEALIVALEDYGRPEPQRKAAERMLKDLGKRSVGPIIQHFSEQPSDMTGLEWQLMKILDDHMDETIPAVMAFIGDAGKYNREVGIQVLRGQGPRRKKYPLDKIDGLKELLAKCSTDKDKKVRAAARSLLLQMGGSSDSALDTVLTGLNDPSWDVRFQTILSITHDRKGRQWTSEQKSRIASTLVAMLAESMGARDYLNNRYIL